MIVLQAPYEFEWNQGNKGKNFRKHGVSDEECEEVFFYKKKKIFADILHSGREKRYILVGGTKAERLLFIVFTLRDNKIRIISARNLNKKEYMLL